MKYEPADLRTDIENMVHFSFKDLLANISTISTIAGELAVATQPVRVRIKKV